MLINISQGMLGISLGLSSQKAVDRNWGFGIRKDNRVNGARKWWWRERRKGFVNYFLSRGWRTLSLSLGVNRKAENKNKIIGQVTEK